MTSKCIYMHGGSGFMSATEQYTNAQFNEIRPTALLYHTESRVQRGNQNENQNENKNENR